MITIFMLSSGLNFNIMNKWNLHRRVLLGFFLATATLSYALNMILGIASDFQGGQQQNSFLHRRL